MKLFLLCLSLSYSANAFSAAGLKFSCKNFELGEKDHIAIDVDLEDVACKSTTPFPCWRAEGWLAITAGKFEDKVRVRYKPDYQRFFLYEYENKTQEKEKMKFTVRSDERLVDNGFAPGTLEIVFSNSPFNKKLTYSLSCQRRE